MGSEPLEDEADIKYDDVGTLNCGSALQFLIKISLILNKVRSSSVSALSYLPNYLFLHDVTFSGLFINSK